MVGNATGDAERKTSPDGAVTYATFRMGISGAKNRTNYFSVCVFGNQAEPVARYVTKGKQVLVEGRIEASEKGHFFTVVAERVVFGRQTKSGGAETTKSDEAGLSSTS